MQCEICGSETGKLTLIELEGSRLLVCPSCSSSGKIIEDDFFKEEEKKQVKARVIMQRKEQKPFSAKKFDLGLDLVDDYGLRVRKARNAKKLTREELAKKLFEKASIIEKIEKHSMKPSDKLIEKFEKFFDISLKEESAEAENPEDFSSNASDNEKLTLEHFIKKKK